MAVLFAGPSFGSGNSPDPKAPPAADPKANNGEATYKNAPSPICSTPTSSAANVNTDCENAGPVNETAIAVNPTNSGNIVASANDYQLRLTSGGSVQETVLSRAHVSFDAGHTWTTYPIRFNGYAFTGDPSLAFDADGTAYLATLANAVGFNELDVVLSHSSDGGRTWSNPRVVAAGQGSLRNQGVLNDHPVIAAWGHGNVIVTWIKYILGQHASSLVGVPILDAVSHDGGNTFSKPNDISGSAPFCQGLESPTACDQTWGNAPAVSPTGRIVVTFYDTYQYTPDGATNLGRDTHLAVTVDPVTGALSDGPYRIGLAYDGINEQDYPVSVDGRQTLHDSELRLLSQGNIAADPTDATGKHFAVVWFDDRNAAHPVDPDPYKAVTNADVIVSQTFDGGATWSSPSAIAEPGDQFMPWAAYDSAGRLRIGFFDRSYDAENHKYGYTVATETAPGALAFSLTQATTQLSDPTTGDRWFRTTVNQAFPDVTRFVGDYSGIATTPNHVVAYWTDSRGTTCFNGVCGSGEDAYFATVP